MGGCRYENEFGVDVGGSGFRVVRGATSDVHCVNNCTYFYH